MLKGLRVAILGAGRSGHSVAEAVRALGGTAIIYDRNPNPAEGVVGNWDQPFTSIECDLVVTSPGVPMQSPVLQGTFANGIPVWSEIEFAYGIAKAPLAAITGTNGKSTTTVMTWLALIEAGFDAKLCGNIAGSGYPEQTLTEAAINSTLSQILVAEISSFQLEWIHQFRPVAAAITNISPDHLDRYGGSFPLYRQTKQKIFQNMKASVGSVRSDRFEVPEIEAEFPFKEPHNRENAKVAAQLAVAIAGEHKLPDILRGIARFTSLDNRLEFVGERNGIRIINNTMCTNPAAVIASSQAVEGPQHLLMGGKRKMLTFERVGDHLRENGHKAYLFGADREEINEQMGGNWPLFDTIQEAFRAATDKARPGETIMLAPGCASQDQFEDFRHRGNVFKEIAKEWLNDYALPDS